MGTYVNPGNQAFKRISGSNYVDKTALIELFNDRIGGDESLQFLNLMNHQCWILLNLEIL